MMSKWCKKNVQYPPILWPQLRIESEISYSRSRSYLWFEASVAESRARLRDRIGYATPIAQNLGPLQKHWCLSNKMHVVTTMESQLESATATPIEQNDAPFQNCAYMCTMMQSWNHNSNRLRLPLSNKMVLRFWIVHTCAQNAHWSNYGITTRIGYGHPCQTKWCLVSDLCIHVHNMHLYANMESQLESATATPLEQNDAPFQNCGYMSTKCALMQRWHHNSNRLRPPLSNKLTFWCIITLT